MNSTERMKRRSYAFELIWVVFPCWTWGIREKCKDCCFHRLCSLLEEDYREWGV